MHPSWFLLLNSTILKVFRIIYHEKKFIKVNFKKYTKTKCQTSHVSLNNGPRSEIDFLIFFSLFPFSWWGYFCLIGWGGGGKGFHTLPWFFPKGLDGGLCYMSIVYFLQSLFIFAKLKSPFITVSTVMHPTLSISSISIIKLKNWKSLSFPIRL